MKYNFYDENDQLVNPSRESLEYEPYEKYAIKLDNDGNEIGEKLMNVNYDSEKARLKQKQRSECHVLASCDEQLLAELNAKRINTSYEFYDWREARIIEYGSITEQIEFISENGLEAWQAKVTDIKNKHPKS